MIEYPFKRFNSKILGELLKPIVRVTLGGPKESIDVFMLVDSGADLSFLPYSAGEAIGLEIDMSNRREVHGIGEGSVPYILSNILLTIDDIQINARVGWAMIEEVPFLLGRLDVFREFSITFSEAQNKIIFEKEDTAS